MIITSLGDGGLKIQTSKTAVLIEPLKGGLSGRLKADILIRTSKEDMPLVADRVVKGPGEYEIHGIEIEGHSNYVYLIKVEDMRLGYFGRESAADLARLDIMFVPPTADFAKTIRQLHPKLVVTLGSDAKDLEKELGLKADKQDKLVVKKKDLLDTKDFRLVVLDN